MFGNIICNFGAISNFSTTKIQNYNVFFNKYLDFIYKGVNSMQRYSDCPQVLREFLTYHETIKGQSQRTISEYYLDLRMFFRFIKLMRNDMPITTDINTIPIKDIDIDFIRSITTSEIFDFLSYLCSCYFVQSQGSFHVRKFYVHFLTYKFFVQRNY